MKKALALVVISLLPIMAGCCGNRLNQGELDFVEANYMNAALFHDRIKDDEEIPKYVRNWIEHEAQIWRNTYIWATGREPQ